MVVDLVNKQQKLWCFLVIFIFISVSFGYPILSNPNSINTVDSQQKVSGFASSVLIEPGEEYVIKYTPSSHSFSKITKPVTNSFSETLKKAIVKTPDWLKDSLILQFNEIKNPLPYAYLILNASKKHTDEIAFCIAHSPLGNPPDPSLISRNVKQIYMVEAYISYANIIEINEDSADYYSTIQYSILDKNQTINRMLPKDIYYWYIVHPQILSETPSFIYEYFWRDYIFYHNDIGYPLLLEKIRNISFLWDEQSYHQHANRDWQESIMHHPTGIEAVSYWVGKTVPYQATGDRPGQPNLIAHQHNGWCGELQRIAVAGLRSVLIPSVSVCNIAEDHVWREFYDQGWHQNDNWWSDTGGTVDTPLVYADGWGKDMSSVFSWRGDGVVSDVSSRYIPKEDQVNVSFLVTDLTGNSLDGVRVTALVNGLKDISWYKNKILDALEKFWSFLPKSVQESFLENIYHRITNRIENTSDVIDGLTISIWNYTDAQGVCDFTLGKHDEYVFLIQQPLDQLPFPFASWTIVKRLKNAVNTDFSIRFPTISSERKPEGTIHENSSDEDLITFSASLNSNGFQYQANVRNNDIGQYPSKTPLSFFILNEQEYIKYDNNKRFKSNYFKRDSTINDNIILNDKPYYIVLYNPHQKIHSQVNLNFSITKETSEEYITIIKPSTTTFQNPQIQVGETIEVTGISSDECILSINNKNINIPSGEWKKTLNTISWKPGFYTLKVNSKNCSTEKQITLIDSIPPTTKIQSPTSYEIISLEEKQYIIHGISSDNHMIKAVELSIDDCNWIRCQGTTQWMKTINITHFSPGIHKLSIKTVDKSNNQQIIQQSFIINDTSSPHNPSINTITWSPKNPTNETTVSMYTNITTDSMFPLKKAMVEYQIKQNIFSKTLFEYAQHPIQQRHLEDPKKNQTNQPVYGCELGRFPTNETITIRIIAIDVAHNREVSNWEEIVIK
ncbi:MAG: hypothetical protein KGY67_02380 [Candidatus Thermoplasmatota archaeon]|nr:hypothetical protein [Candidatus Thermoplasmatota archaeon]